MQTFISLGAASPHFPQRLFLEALANDQSKVVEIRSTYFLNEIEIQFLENSKSVVVRSIIQARMGQPFANPSALIQFLSSQQGLETQRAVDKEVNQTLRELRANNILIIGLTINPSNGEINVTEPVAASLLSYMDQILPPQRSIFSYFPADRSLPFGETNVQIGAGDTSQQLESHNSQPQVKYTRLKNMIFNAVIMSAEEKEKIISEFEKIFTRILKSRKIHSIGVNTAGLLSVLIEDTETQRTIEIDNLSSGEKSLILTFLLISRSIEPNGIVLFDEPELHLNSLVCKEMLGFLLEQYSIPNNIQFIICSHSPEILLGAFSNEDCNLLYIKNSKNITKVGRSAVDEYSDALEKIGASVSESLLYEGRVFVEGPEDVDLLNMGFPTILKRYLITELGGRKEVEKTAKQLQKLELEGKNVSPILIIIDRDRSITELSNSEAVKILQWPRYCIENYLIDFEVIVEVLKDSKISNKVDLDESQVSRIFREHAMTQILGVATLEVYKRYSFKSPFYQNEDFHHENSSIESIAKALYDRITLSLKSLEQLSNANWIENFKHDCEIEKKHLEEIWASKWKEQCDGKRLFNDFQKSGMLKISQHDFKRKIMQRMKETSSDNWRILERLIKENINTA